ncbi:hypothetical protein [Sandaracinus amylolyticus]|uniref:hypothetical protein n=1 Tax=Sandaracinus amylolyticus TaxID=927083 RepID=UPI001F384FC1|nr:hypothetical protein [Sandaracinus amylolyticus]UJR81333.1 Hypothetical protein I5071_33900 [Sandaracinus amylolyticus]
MALVDEVVKATGLSHVIADDVVRRALVRGGVDPVALTRPDLARAIPSLRKALGLFLRGTELDRALVRVEHLARDRS